jgi:hypothetical protein
MSSSAKVTVYDVYQRIGKLAWKYRILALFYSVVG